MWDRYGRSGLEQPPHCRSTVKLKEETVRLILEKNVSAYVRVEHKMGKTALQRWDNSMQVWSWRLLSRLNAGEDHRKILWDVQGKENFFGMMKPELLYAGKFESELYRIL